MRLYLKRIFKGPEYTIGHLYREYNGNWLFVCDTLEPVDRGLKKTDPLSTIKARKVAGKTAIPTGTYSITLMIQSLKFRLRYWAKFCLGFLPTILGTPGFDRILIHVGNTVKDTEGCILVGVNRLKGKVLDSAATFERLYNLLKEANDRKENLSITIE